MRAEFKVRLSRAIRGDQLFLAMRILAGEQECFEVELVRVREKAKFYQIGDWDPESRVSIMVGVGSSATTEIMLSEWYNEIYMVINDEGSIGSAEETLGRVRLFRERIQELLAKDLPTSFKCQYKDVWYEVPIEGLVKGWWVLPEGFFVGACKWEYNKTGVLAQEIYYLSSINENQTVGEAAKEDDTVVASLTVAPEVSS